MDVLRLDSPGYPERLLDRMGAAAPAAVEVIGDPELLTMRITAWFASGRTPADLVLPALHLAERGLAQGGAVASGFHSRVERECLDLMIEAERPVIVWAARGIGSFRLARSWRRALEMGAMAVVSGHGPRIRRLSARSADERNRMVAAAADRVFVVSASPGGRIHRLAGEVAARAQRLQCFDHPSNEDLLLLGAAPLRVRPSHRAPPPRDETT
jgi:predicted Rossmann fold nucleotide-binding protein DprA/Smf involved in DNA uptake